jgi:hypothetical protein
MNIMTTGTTLIATERKRQIDMEGYDDAHDDTHRYDLVYAAQGFIEAVLHPHPTRTPRAWPEDWAWKIPKKYPDSISLLVKAGAMIAAEIDRRLRAGEKP